MDDEHFLRQALQLSQESVARGGYPVGALVVREGEVLGTGLSDGKQLCDATSHAEVVAIRNASQTIQKRNLTNAVLYTSYEPCLMCFSACFWAYISKVVYAVRKEAYPHNFNEGTHDLHALNGHNRRSIELKHVDSLEPEAINIITTWEQTL
jgi:guanine deaminase